MEAIDQVVTDASVLAWIAGALVYFYLTVLADKSTRTVTAISIYLILANASILALTAAVINIDVTVFSCPSWDAVTVISTNEISARISINTGISLTLISIQLTGGPNPLWRTNALKAINKVFTDSSAGTRVGRTFINIDSTGWTGPSRWTMTLKPGGDLMADAIVCTGVGSTSVFSYFTVLSRVAISTGTVIFIRLRVHAGPSVLTRMMGSTIVQIFITEESAPVGLAVTLPG